MKKRRVLKFLLLLFIIGICEISNAQVKKNKSGRITKEELSRKVCESDSSAYSEVLYEKGSLSIDVENDTYVKHLKTFRRLKIYNKFAYHYANFELTYNRINSRISKIKACTYNLKNGKIVKTKLKSKDILVEKLIDGVLKKKFALKDVEEGSIIEYQYTVTRPIGISLIDWNFQDEMPVRRSDLVIFIPNSFKYRESLTGYERVKRTMTSTFYQNQFTNIYSYSAKNLPAFKKEVFIDCREDYISKIRFELAYVSFPDGEYRSFSSNLNSICKALVNNTNLGEVFKERAYFKNIL